MSQLYEKKCDCKYYDDLNDHGASLLKMELPEYEAAYNSSSGYMIGRALRFMGYITVAVLLGYSLWRIHVIESTLLASDRLHNLTRTIALESSRLHHARVTRSVPMGHHGDVNAIGGDKELPRGSMLTAKNEYVPTKRRRPADEREFEYLVHSLFDTIQMMHNDTDRRHFDSNMKAVFQAWFPVFDALLPEELVESQLDPMARNTRSVSEDNIMRSVADKTSEESSEEKKGKVTRSVADKTSEESSEEKKGRITRSVADKTSEESSEEKKGRVMRSVADKTSEESSEEKKGRFARSVSESSEESKSSSEEEKRRVIYNKNNKSKESSEEEEKKDKSIKKEKSSEESVESSESSESKEKKDNEKNELFYKVVSLDQDGSKTVIQVN